MLTFKLISFYLFPLMLAFLFTIRKFTEKTIVQLSIISGFLTLSVSLSMAVEFFMKGAVKQTLDLATIHIGEHHIGFSLFFDELSFAILILTGILSILICLFSGRYLHRENGFKRFFLVINFFVFGLQLLATAGSLDLFFAAWEIIGLCSFLLIGFYHERTRPTRNAFRIFSIYRICDVGLLFSVILGHIVLKDADHFYYLINESQRIIDLIPSHWKTTLFFLLIWAAIGKSAQFPFINWPARAMEGPTPSSAIFYGALSIHCGVILLYRTYPLYKDSLVALAFIFGIGLLSTLLAIGIGRVQSNVKGQIAYASVAQIGIMFMELSLGMHKLVVAHFVLHSLLRCYQLLTSPSIVVDHIKTMDMQNAPSIKKSIEEMLPVRIKSTLFSIGLQEGFLSVSERGFFPIPLIRLKILVKNYRYLLLGIMFLLAFVIFQTTTHADITLRLSLIYFFGLSDLFITFLCLLSEKSPQKIWDKFLLAQICFIIANLLLKNESHHGILLYSIGAIPCWIIGRFALSRVGNICLNRYHGLYFSHRRSYRYFLFAFIGLAGYPLTPIFWAEDFIFAEVILSEPSLLFMFALSVMLNGLIAGKILVKTYWGFPAEVRY